MKFEDISKKVKKFSKDTVEEVQKMNEVRQLNGRVNDTKKQINGIYLDIGRKLYDMYKEAPLEGFEAEIRSIDEKLAQIQQLRDQIRGVKGVVLCPCCNMEVSVTERFCSNCGNKMPEIVEIADPDEDAVVVEATDVTEANAALEAAKDTEAEAEEVKAEAENIEAEAGEMQAEAEEVKAEAESIEAEAEEAQAEAEDTEVEAEEAQAESIESDAEEAKTEAGEEPV